MSEVSWKFANLSFEVVLDMQALPLKGSIQANSFWCITLLIPKLIWCFLHPLNCRRGSGMLLQTLRQSGQII